MRNRQFRVHAVSHVQLRQLGGDEEVLIEYTFVGSIPVWVVGETSFAILRNNEEPSEHALTKNGCRSSIPNK
jgi:hypothetical protein